MIVHSTGVVHREGYIELLGRGTGGGGGGGGEHFFTIQPLEYSYYTLSGRVLVQPSLVLYSGRVQRRV